MNIPFHKAQIDDDDIQAVVDTLKSGWITTGPVVHEFEQAFAEYAEAEHAIAVNSCTGGMHLALAALEVGRGDGIITTPYTFAATAAVIHQVGATPIFIDIREDFNIDPEQIEPALERARSTGYAKTEGNGKRGANGTHGNGVRPGKVPSKVRGIMPVHIAGLPCDMRTIMNLAHEYDLKVVEDAAHALEARVYDYNGEPEPLLATDAMEESKGGPWIGSSELACRPRPPIRSGKKIGAIGDATCFSFYATKNITSAEGGMISTNDGELADRVRRLALHGMSRDAWKRYRSDGSWYYEIVECGFKYNLPDLLGALGLSQLRKAEQMHARRREIVALYNQELGDCDELILPTDTTDARHAWHLYIIRISPGALSISRSEFIEELRERGIGTSVHFIPLHLHPWYQREYGYKKGDFPVAESVYESSVTLPLYPRMTDEQVLYVARAIKEVICRYR